MATRAAPPGTQAILRAIRLLKVFSASDAELTLLQLSSGAALTKTTAHRLLAALESEGLVSRGAARHTYRLGPALVALGMQALRTSDLRATLRPFLTELAQATGETATLEVLSDERMLILEEVSGLHLVSATAEIGTQWPVHATSTGKALMAYLPEDQVQRVLQPPLRRYTEHTRIEPEALRRQLEQVRRQGYAVAVEELEEGFVAVGAAFRGPLGDVAGAISIGGPTNRIGPGRRAELGALVRATAERISKELGHT